MRWIIQGAVLAGIAAGLTAEAPLNLSRAKAAVKSYHASGAYEADVRIVADQAIVWLRERAAERGEDEKLAVVFDIDETVLSNYPQMVREDFGYNPPDWLVWVEQAAAPPLRPMREVYRVARALDFAVIFITGREDPQEREGTTRNLHQVGMGDYEQLILKGAEDTAPTAAERKAKRRAQLEADGWTIVASIGDQESDLAGGHAERTFKVPNPFYEVP